jgi:hypothetical protein
MWKWQHARWILGFVSLRKFFSLFPHSSPVPKKNGFSPLGIS